MAGTISEVVPKRIDLKLPATVSREWLRIEKVRAKDKNLFLNVGVMKHLKIKTRLIDEKFASVMGECVI